MKAIKVAKSNVIFKKKKRIPCHNNIGNNKNTLKIVLHLNNPLFTTFEKRAFGIPIYFHKGHQIFIASLNILLL